MIATQGIRRCLAGTFHAVVCVALGFLTGISAGAAPRQLLPDHVPPAVANLQPIDRLPGASRLELAIGLPLRNRDALTNLLEQIYDPASTNYHRYLTPDQFAEMFGPSPQDYQAVIDFAQAHGLTVTKTHSNRVLLRVNGAVADIEKMLQVTLRRYPHPTEKRQFFAPDVAPTLDLNVPVLSISGLDNYIVPRPMNLSLMSVDQTANATPASGSGPSGSFRGNDFRAAYVPGIALTGTGQAVGLLEFDGYYPNDITAYESQAGLPNVTLTNVVLDGFTGPPGSDNLEVALDIEMAISMAPGLSKVVIYEGSLANDILTQMATDKLANQLSASWTYPVDSTTAQIFQQLATQGQSFFNASGDSGAYGGSPDQPTDDPYITIVGGTTLHTSGPGGSWVSENVWNWYTTGQGTAGSSGGISSTFGIPTWQKGISMTASKGSTSKRNLPDVALTADNIWVNYNNGGAGGVGGTSAACPLWAAFTALVNQQATANGSAPVGFVNPAIYAIGKGANYATNFHDITVGNNTNSTVTTKFFAVAGYDLCTGWGTPIGANLIYALAPGAPVITAQPANLVVAPGNNATFTVSAVGSGTLIYHWKFNSNNISFGTNASCTITNAQTANQGTYSVVVSNTLGSVTSSNVTLTVNFPPSISSQPQNQTIPQGSNVTFSVVASGAPAPTYQWQYNATNIALATSSSFTLSNALFANQGNYAVIVSNSGGAVTSSNAVLTVLSPPSITSQPASHTLNPGIGTVLAVGATGSPALNYQWVLNGSSIASATNSTYRIQNAQASQAGSYWAVVSNNYGTVTSAVATIIVRLPPSITVQPQGQSFTVGNNASFTVTASGPTPLSYQWFFNNTNLTDNGHVSGSQSATLNLANLLTGDAGNYQVVITNAYGSTNSGVAALTVAKANSILTWTSPTAISYGTALDANQLNATANPAGTFAYTPLAGTVLNTGSNTLSVTFIPNDPTDFNGANGSVSLLILPAPLTVTATNATRVYGQTNPAFTATIAGATNGDVFTASATCAATITNLPGNYPIIPSVIDTNNRLGNYTLTAVNATLTVTPAAAPTILSVTPNSGDTNGGTTVTILGTGFETGATVSFGSVLATSVTVTNSTNIIAVTPPASLGMVDVGLTNADGQSVIFTNGFTYATPFVADMSTLQITGQPTNQAAAVGGNASFTVTATGAAPLVYQWAFNNANLTDATNVTFSLTNIQPLHAGPYQVIVTNLYGAATSSPATLSVLGVPVSFITSTGGGNYSNGQFTLQLTGLTGQGAVIILTSTNLTDWSPIFTNPPGFGQIQFIDVNASNYPYGFYRATTPAAP